MPVSPPVFLRRTSIIIPERLESSCEAVGVRPNQPLTLDAELRADLGWDSLDIIELVMEMEDRYHIQIGEDQSDRLLKADATLADALALCPDKKGLPRTAQKK